jgi:hypothetical protein
VAQAAALVVVDEEGLETSAGLRHSSDGVAIPKVDVGRREVEIVEIAGPYLD